MSQYEMNIVYIHGDDNCVADALSRIPEGAFPDKQTTKAMPPAPYLAWKLLLHNEHCQYLDWVFGFPAPSGLIPSYHPAHHTYFSA